MARCWWLLVLAAPGLPQVIAARACGRSSDIIEANATSAHAEKIPEARRPLRQDYKSCIPESPPRWTPLLKEETVLGEGTTGQVRFYRLQGPCKGDVVVKELKGVDEEDMDREIELYKKFGDHPNIVSLYDYRLDEFTLCAHLLMEAALGGELPDAYREALPSRLLSTLGVTRNRNRAKAKILSMALVGLLSGLAHMHNNGVLHLDMKPENIYSAESGDTCIKTRSCRYMIGDLGVAQRVKVVNLSDGSTIAGVECKRRGKFACPGTYRWQPPETRGEAVWAPHGPYGPLETMKPFWTDRGDVWALGMTLHEVISPVRNIVLHGKEPNFCAQEGLPDKDCLEAQLMLVQSKHYLPDNLKILLSWMVAPDWRDRPSAQEALDHARHVIEPLYGVFQSPPRKVPDCIRQCSACDRDSFCKVSKGGPVTCSAEFSRLNTAAELPLSSRRPSSSSEGSGVSFDVDDYLRGLGEA